MSNLQICQDVLERARDADDTWMERAALACARAARWGFKMPPREWLLVKAFWLDLQEAENAEVAGS